MGEYAWPRLLNHYCPDSSPTVSWCAAPAAFQQLGVGERNKERKTMNDVA